MFPGDNPSLDSFNMGNASNVGNTGNASMPVQNVPDGMLGAVLQGDIGRGTQPAADPQEYADRVSGWRSLLSSLSSNKDMQNALFLLFAGMSQGGGLQGLMRGAMAAKAYREAIPAVQFGMEQIRNKDKYANVKDLADVYHKQAQTQQIMQSGIPHEQAQTEQAQATAQKLRTEEANVASEARDKRAKDYSNAITERMRAIISASSGGGLFGGGEKIDPQKAFMQARAQLAKDWGVPINDLADQSTYVYPGRKAGDPAQVIQIGDLIERNGEVYIYIGYGRAKAVKELLNGLPIENATSGGVLPLPTSVQKK